jgi:NTP pyrophosphatase (non-canonical NTP hydrolase)
MDRAQLSFADFQTFIRERYGTKDSDRGVSGTFLWFMEEVGELASALSKSECSDSTNHDLAGEFADVLGWLTTLANLKGVDLSEALHERYLEHGGRNHKA